MNLLEIALVVIVVAYVLIGRMKSQTMRAKKLLVLPAVLSVIGVSSIAHITSPAAIGFVAAGCVVGVVIGVVRGATVHLFARDGVTWMRYRVSSVALWVVAIGIRVAMVPVENVIDADAANAANAGLLLTIGLGILAESAVVLHRALRLESTPVWAIDKTGHNVTAPWLTDLHAKVSSVVE